MTFNVIHLNSQHPSEVQCYLGRIFLATATGLPSVYHDLVRYYGHLWEPAQSTRVSGEEEEVIPCTGGGWHPFF